MKLWILRPVDQSLLDRFYDVNRGFVVRAPDEENARLLAEFAVAEEKGFDKGLGVWTDPSITTCVELTGEGAPGVVMQDFNAG